MIPAFLSEQFTRALRDRGDHYAAQGRVRLTSLSETGITAIVRGSEPYDVRLDFGTKRESVTMWCTCPYASDYGVCKHMWALLRAAEGKSDLWIFQNDGSAKGASGAARPVQRAPRARKRPRDSIEPIPAWKQALDALAQSHDVPILPEPERAWATERRIVYLLDLDATELNDRMTIDVRAERMAGTGKGKGRFTFTDVMWRQAPDPDDREIADMLLGAPRDTVYGPYANPDEPRTKRRFQVDSKAFATLRRIVGTGRCRVHSRSQPRLHGATLTLDEGAQWRFRVRICGDDATGRWRAEPLLTRDGEDVPLTAAAVITSGGPAIVNDRLAFVDADRHLPLIKYLAARPLVVPRAHLHELANTLTSLPDPLPVELPDDVPLVELRAEPQPRLIVTPAQRDGWRAPAGMWAQLEFAYEDVVVPFGRIAPRDVLRDSQRVLVRQPEFEGRAYARLRTLGVTVDYDYRSGARRLVVPTTACETLAQTLAAEGWHVEMNGVRLLSASIPTAAIHSGIDWFDLAGGVNFGDTQVPFPELLAALHRGEQTIALPGGARGALPVDWLRRHAALLSMGAQDPETGTIRFGRAQVLLLDSLLASITDTQVDEPFAQLRASLHDFDGIEAVDAPAGFTGTLRPYQRDGLGWLHFLQRFGIGGCLADDMGLGKTIQVLALLEGRRAESAGPSLVVVPKSLVFNWKAEAARFAPALRVLDFTGAGRRRALDRADFDLAITTYGTLRRDAPQLRDVEFDYVILDEAQAIKNAGTVSAKAARLLRGRHRLTLTGTPIENRLSDLWSLCEFLNPGMLGTRKVFAGATEARGTYPADREQLARALRPLILRRRKDDVARDLPARTEQTLMVELEKEQRRLYDELRQHVRADLLGRLDRVGIAKARMHVLEALLRLRQAACHPALLDEARGDDASAKLDTLLPQLAEVAAEGHKALVFSQFTTFLRIIERYVKEAGIGYEYLDGKTQDRAGRVRRFQDDPACQVFLISLRAGGHGLNLTAAEYVFLLDPWWNPAVEAQAIDRAHRIGQSRPVVAVRIIARDTVEEKVLLLQERKRELADAILAEDQGVLSRIGREELELLLE